MVLKSAKKNRNRNQIILAIFDAIGAGRKLKSQITQAANLSSGRAVKYLDGLVSNGAVEVIGREYHVTSKGIGLWRELRRMKEANMTDRFIVGDDGDREQLCVHGVGHGRGVHTCDGENHSGRCPLSAVNK